MMEELLETDLLPIKKEDELETLQIKLEDDKAEYLKIKEEDEELELMQTRKEEEQAVAFYLKVEEVEPEGQHLKEEEEELGVKQEGNHEEDSGSRQANGCTSRWRHDLVEHKQSPSSPSGSAGRSRKDWNYAELIPCLSPLLHPVSSDSRLSPRLTSGAEEAERSETPSSVGSCATSPSSNFSTPPSPAEAEGVGGSRSPSDTTQRRTTAASDSEASRASGAAEGPPHKAHVPNTEQDEAYYFALSTVPLLLSLSRSRRRRAKREILTVLDLLNEEEEGEQGAASSPHPPPTESTA